MSSTAQSIRLKWQRDTDECVLDVNLADASVEIVSGGHHQAISRGGN